MSFLFDINFSRVWAKKESVKKRGLQMLLIHTQYNPEENYVIAKGLHMTGQTFIIHYFRISCTSKFIWNGITLVRINAKSPSPRI